MARRLVRTSIAILLLHASPLAAEEDLVTVDFEKASFEVPAAWIDPASRLTPDTGPWGGVILHIPIDALSRVDHALVLEDVVSASILLNDNSAAGEWLALWKEKLDTGLADVASADQGALAFDGVAFDTLYVSTSASGKSRVPALFLIGMASFRSSSILVSAKIDTRLEPSNVLRYNLTLATVTDRHVSASIFLELEMTRALTPADFQWLDFAKDILNDRAFE